MYIVDILAGIAVGILVGFGVGGGGLIIIYLTLIKSSEQLSAQSVNLSFFIITSIVALFFHLKKHRINYKTVCVISAAGAVGAGLGSIIIKYTDPILLGKFFGVFLIISGLIELLHKK